MKKILFLVVVVTCWASCKSDNKSDSREVDAIETTNPAEVENDTRHYDHVLNLVNQYRIQGCRCGRETMPPVAPLRWSDKLEQAADAHTQDMVTNQFFSHRGSDGSSPSDRVDRVGYNWRATAENIAQGQRSIEEVVRSWIDSPSHCRNIMNGRYTEMGLASASNFWTQVFGAR